MTSFTDPGIARLTGSSPSAGDPPNFSPIAAARLAGGTGHQSGAELRSTHDPIFAALAAHKRAFDALIPLCGLSNDRKAEWDAADAAEVSALSSLIGTIPEGLAGLAAFSRYLWDHLSTNDVREGLADTAIASIAAACDDLMRTVSGGKQQAGSATADDELLVLGRQWGEADAAHYDAQTAGDAEQQLDRLSRLEAIALKIVNRPAVTLEGLKLKARIAASCSFGNGREAVAEMARQSGPIGLPMAWSIVFDLGGIMSAPATQCSNARIHGDAELIALGAELEAVQADARSAVGLSDEEYDLLDAATVDRALAITSQIESHRATTIDGLSVKVQAVLWHRIKHDPGLTSADPGERALASLVRDCRHLRSDMAASADTVLLALGRKLERLETEIIPLRRAYNDHAAGPEVEQVYEDADDVMTEVMTRIARQRATTLQGFMIKAFALASIYHGETFTPDNVPFIRGNALDVELTRSIISDLVNQARMPGCGVDRERAADVDERAGKAA